MLKGIIFDMDGVLINSEPVHYEIWKMTMKERKVDLSYEIYKPCIGSTAGFLMNLLSEAYGVDKDDRKLMEEHEAIKWKVMKERGYPLIEGVPELLGRLKQAGYRLAIASSSPEPYIRDVVRSLELEPYFHVICSGESVRNPKPAPDIFLRTAKLLGLSPDECIVVEDSTNGCRAAKAAGICCVGYYNPDSGEQDLSTAEIIVEGYEEIDGGFMEKVYRRSRKEPVVIGET
ncbi:HAD family hydrolase [Lactonifactor longoviformis]|uniref:HAD family hydrolase n=1 Tax=Lactonifactor longoviformis TaxID=341220 RepID=UPI0036F37AB6